MRQSHNKHAKMQITVYTYILQLTMFLLKHNRKTEENSRQINLEKIKPAKYDIFNPKMPCFFNFYKQDKDLCPLAITVNSSCFHASQKSFYKKTSYHTCCSYFRDLIFLHLLCRTLLLCFPIAAFIFCRHPSDSNNTYDLSKLQSV